MDVLKTLWNIVSPAQAPPLVPRSRPTSTEVCTSAHAYSRSAGLQRLPLEILDSITIQLERYQIAVLGLTCKHFFRQIEPHSGRYLLHDTPRRLKFLRLLEEDHPHLLVCSPCGHLYDWKNSKQHGAFPDYTCPERKSPFHRSAMTLCDVHEPYSMKAEIRDLILRADRLGPEYGLPTSYLTHTCRGHRDGGMPKSFECRIRKGGLMVHRQDTVLLMRSEPITKQLFSGMMHIRSCQHVGRGLLAVIICAIFHVLRSDGQAVGPSAAWKCSQRVSCAKSANDLRVSVHRHDLGLLVSVHSWLAFGNRDTSCRSPEGKQHEGETCWHSWHNGDDARNLEDEYNSDGDEGIAAAGENATYSSAHQQTSKLQQWSCRGMSAAGLTAVLPDLQFRVDRLGPSLEEAWSTV